MRWVLLSFGLLLIWVAIRGMDFGLVRHREGPWSDRAECIMNIRNVQRAVREYQDSNGFRPGDPGWEKALLFGENRLLGREPTCPGGGTYTWAEGPFPKVGVLVLRCSHGNHVPVEHNDW